MTHIFAGSQVTDHDGCHLIAQSNVSDAQTILVIDDSRAAHVPVPMPTANHAQ
jgi:hypothetical protein